MYMLALFINCVNPGKWSKRDQAKNNVKFFLNFNVLFLKNLILSILFVNLFNQFENNLYIGPFHAK